MEQQLEKVNGGQPASASGKHAWEVEQRIRGTLKVMTGAWIDLARDFYEFREARMYRDLGYDSLEEWAAQPDIDVSSRYVYELTVLWGELVVKRELDADRLRELPPSKLSAMLPAIRRGQVEVDQALADAGSLGRDDIRARYGDKKQARDPTGDAGTHIGDGDARYYQCSSCGSWVPMKHPAAARSPRSDRCGTTASARGSRGSSRASMARARWLSSCATASRPARRCCGRSAGRGLCSLIGSRRRCASASRSGRRRRERV